MKVMAYYSVSWDEAYRKCDAGCEQKTMLGTQVMMLPLLCYGVPWTLMCLNTSYKDHCFKQLEAEHHSLTSSVNFELRRGWRSCSETRSKANLRRCTMFA